MVAHTHDEDRITFGCPGCIARAEQARIDNAPLRQVTWHCSYSVPTGKGYEQQHTLSFTLAVRVPDGWGPDKVDERYASMTGEAFVLALPSEIPMEHTDIACERMEIDRVVFGRPRRAVRPRTRPVGAAAAMNVGDRVTIVHGPGPEGSITRNTPGTVVLPIVHGRPAPPSPVRRDGMVAVRPDGSPHDVWIWVDPMYLDQGLLETSPRHRVTDPDTARAAADTAGERLTEHQLLVLEALVTAGRAGLIDHEHEARNGLIPTSAGKRRKELERLGLCEPTDQKRPTSRSALAIVHRVTARGLAVWQSHQQKGAA